MTRSLRLLAFRLGDGRLLQWRRRVTVIAVLWAAVLCSPMAVAGAAGQSPDPNAGAAQWLGLSPNGTDTLALVYELVLEHSRLTGRLGVAEVDLENTDGVWTGRFGGQLISEARVVSTEADAVIVEVSSAGTSEPTAGTSEPTFERPRFERPRASASERSNRPRTGVNQRSDEPRSTADQETSLAMLASPRNTLTGRRRFPIVTTEDGSVETRMTGGPSEINGAVILSADGTQLRLGGYDELASDNGPVYRGREIPRYTVVRQLEAYGSLVPSLIVKSDPVL